MQFWLVPKRYKPGATIRFHGIIFGVAVILTPFAFPESLSPLRLP